MDDLKAYYRLNDDFTRYLEDNEERVEQLKMLYQKHGEFFGERVLDLGCGGGVLGFMLESEGCEYVGIDVNPDMIEAAENHAAEIGSNSKFILGDAAERRLDGTFDTVTCIGNTAAHITPGHMSRILANISDNAEDGASFIFEYRDVVKMLAKGKWKDEMERERGDREIVIETTGFDTEEGRIIQETTDRNTGDSIESFHAIWAPFIAQRVFAERGWEVKESRSSEAGFSDVVEIYEKRR